MAQAAPGTPTTNTNSIAIDEECPRCDRPLRLLENNNPGRADFSGCPGYPNDCAWTGIQLSWSKPCAYCCETLPAGATSWSRKLEGKFSSTGKAVYANFHLREEDCVLKAEDDIPVNARKPSPSDIGKTCQDCLRDGDSVRIAPGDHLVASCVKPWHIGCALKRRRSMVEEITTEADERAARNSAEKARNDETSRNASTSKRPRESLVRGEQLDPS